MRPTKDGSREAKAAVVRGKDGCLLERIREYRPDLELRCTSGAGCTGSDEIYPKLRAQGIRVRARTDG